MPTPPASTTSTDRLTLHQARADIRQQIATHAQQHEGMLVLGHPPGTGKGFNTIEGLKDYLRADPDPGFIVWTSLRKAQLADQDGLSFIPLHGRHAGNCRKLPVRPDRPTLVVTTLEWEADVREALVQRGHSPDLVHVAHYGGLRGSNAYKGFDVLLAQVYHPNLEQTIRTARALFADDPTPLDERIILEERTLTDATGASWRIEVPTAVDPRIAALLHAHREAEMEQVALRGRPLEHPEAQITILASLPLPGLPPTIICAATSSPQSNTGRERATIEGLLVTTRQLLDDGKRVLDTPMIARAASVSVVTVRRHWEIIASRLHLRAVKQRATRSMPRGGQRTHTRAVLVRRGRQVPPRHTTVPNEPSTPPQFELMTDQARNMESITRLIHRPWASRCIRLPDRRTRQRSRRRQPPARAPG